MLFSATATKKVEEITKLALKKEPMYIGVDDSKDAATVEGLEQGKFTDFHFRGDVQKLKFFIFSQVTLFVLRISGFYFCLHF